MIKTKKTVIFDNITSQFCLKTVIVYIENISKAITNIDYFIVDIKIVDKGEGRKVLGIDVDQYLDNLEYVYKQHKLKLLRLPCCKEYTMKSNNIDRVKQVLSAYSDIPIEIFKIHGLGENKYKSLNKKMWECEKVLDNDIESLRNNLNTIMDRVSIINI